MKRSIPVPPPKPKIGAGVPRPAVKAPAPPSPSTAPHSPAEVPKEAGTPTSVVSTSSAATNHRRIVSSAPALGSPSPSPAVSHSSPGTATTPQPKLPPKPPGRPKSGAFLSPATPTPTQDPISIPSHLLLGPADMRKLAAELDISNSELDEINLLFLEMDTDNDGVISIADLLRYKCAQKKSIPAPESESSSENDVPDIVAPEPSKSMITVAFQPELTANGMAKSASAPRVIQIATGSDDEDDESDTSIDDAKAMLADMGLSDSESDSKEPPPVEQTPSPAPAKQQGISFRHIDFASLPQNADDSGDDDDLLADWDGPVEEESKSKHTKSKSTGSSGSGGSGLKDLKKKFSKGALSIKSKIHGAGK